MPPRFFAASFFYSFLFLIFGLKNIALIANTPDTARVWAAMRQLQKDPVMKHAAWSLTLYNIDSDESVLEYNSDMGLMPASTLKIVTTATALATLGSDFRFETRLQYEGNIDDKGTLHGNLYIKGGGDPTLGFERNGFGSRLEEVMQQWVQAAKNAGIRHIDGAIIGDAEIFETATVSAKWLWEDIGNYYGAGACGLSIHENQYNLCMKPAAQIGGLASIVNADPPVPGATFVNEVRTDKIGGSEGVFIYAAPYSELIYVRGYINNRDPDTYCMGTLPDPPLFAAITLQKHLEKNGIKATEAATTLRALRQFADDDHRTTIHSLLSPPLRDIVYWANKRSHNLYCEHLLKMIGHQVYGHGTADVGLRAIKNYWQRKKVNWRGFEMQDGCGLSPMNSVSTRHLSQILKTIYFEPYYNDFNRSLSWAGTVGDHGPLGGHLVGTHSQRNLRAKSGTFKNVRSYSGYVENLCGDTIAFSFIINNGDCDTNCMRNRMLTVMKTFAEMKE